MPKPLEDALLKAFNKPGAKLHGKTPSSMAYATMTDMQKKGEIAPWRKLKGKTVGGGGAGVSGAS